jgi:ribonuclease HI
MLAAIAAELEAGVIEEVSAQQAGFVMPAFTVPKSDGSLRLVLDCRQLNVYIQQKAFKMENLLDLMRLVHPYAFAGTIDLTAAFHHVPVQEELRYYLVFRYDNRFYRYLGLPFGLRSAPRIFSTTLRACVHAMREAWGVVVFQYMDDIIFLDNDSNRLAEIMQRAVRFLRWLGWTVNAEKSRLTPRRVFEYLGMEWNTVDMTVRLTAKKNRQLQKTNKLWIRRARRGQKVQVRAFAGMIGGLSATRVQFSQASLYLTSMYRLLSVATRTVGWDGSVVLSRALLPQLRWWQRQLQASLPRRIQPFVPTATIDTDASDTGWGATLQRPRTKLQLIFGWWHGTMIVKKGGARMTSNEHEMRAVEMTLRHALATGQIHDGEDVLLRSDSTTVVFDVNRQAAGLNLRPALRSLLRFLQTKGIRLQAIHVPGVDNILPDALSRLSPSGDYSLRQGVLQRALELLGAEIQIDWFACRRNRQHEQYCTLQNDRKAAGRDALQQDWSTKQGLMHPPIPLLTRCLEKVSREHASAVLVLPAWRGQLWTPMLQKLRVGPAVILGAAEKILQMGPKMLKKGAKLPPGKMMAVMIQG